jgi:ubiquitin-protein ligase
MTLVQSAIITNKWNNTINYIDSNIGQDEIDIRINNNNIKLLSDFKNYCYVEQNDDNSTQSINLDKLNLELVFLNMSIDNVLKTIDNYFSDKKVNNYIDIYNFTNTFEENTKYKIDYTELLNNYKQNKDEINNNIKNKIPKELLLNQNQIYKLLINEIKHINNNFEYKHYIYPFENNICDLRMKIVFEKTNLELKFTINSKLYPFFPPTLEVISPKLKFSLLSTLMNLPILKICNWQSTISFEWLLLNLHEQLKLIILDYVDNDENSYNDIEFLLLKLNNYTDNNNYCQIPIKIEVPKIEYIKEDKYWKSGTGYGHEFKNSWDINNYIKLKEINQIEVIQILNELFTKIDNDTVKYINNSSLFNYILAELDGINLLVIDDSLNVFTEIFKILNLLEHFFELMDFEFIEKVTKLLDNINSEIIVLLSNINVSNNLYKDISSIYQNYNNFILTKCKLVKCDTDNQQLQSGNNFQEYENIMKSLQFKISNDINLKHKYIKNKDIKIDPKHLTRIITEISSFKSGIPLNYESTIWISVPKNNMNLFSFLISGPKDTPYQDGLFEFHAYLPPDYPISVPQIIFTTTGNETVRFNPNLYNTGKVCLSLLGTWAGNEGETWNPKTSTFLQLLVSIQSLILVDEPYFNEPGYERKMNTETGKRASKEYNEIIQLATIEWGIVNQIKNPPFGFEDVVREHFKRKKDDILQNTKAWYTNITKNKTEFKKQYDILVELLSSI